MAKEEQATATAFASDTASRLADHIQRFLRPHPRADRFASQGREVLAATLRKCVERGAPLGFVLPAFPFKSPNVRDNVLGTEPDTGELLMLRSLAGLVWTLREQYAPGVDLVLVSDGRVFSDLCGVADATVDRYRDGLLRLIERHRLPLRLLDLADLLTLCDGRAPAAAADPAALRVQLLSRYAASSGGGDGNDGGNDDQLLRSHAAHGDVELYCGLKHYLESDLVWPTDMSRSAVRRECGRIAKEVMLRNAAYSMLVHRAFPDHVRLSVHVQDNAGPKFAFNLYHVSTGAIAIGADATFWGTPWHNVVLMQLDGSVRITKKRDAELASAVMALDAQTGQRLHYCVPGRSP